MAESRQVARDPVGACALGIATFAGLGLIRPAPGTWGSVGAAALLLGLALLGGGTLVLFALLFLVPLATVAGFWSWRFAAERFGRADPGQMVIDEVAGLWLGALCIPSSAWDQYPWLCTLLLLAVFRVIDIVKPWPVGAIDRWPGAAGVMVDDLVGGLVAGLAIVPVVV